MASNIDVGLGLGLQAQLQAPAQVFARQQQQKVMEQQAAMKRAAEDEDLYYRLQKDISVSSKDLHRLVKEPVANMTAAAINELVKAKNSGEANWRNKAVDITNNYKNQIAHLSGLSEQYKNYEKNYEMLGNYKTREQQSLRELMNGSQTYTEMLDKAKAKGMTGLDIESGLITSNQFMPRVNLNRELDNTFSKINPTETQVKEIKGPDGTYQEIHTTIPLKIADAAIIAKKNGLSFVPSIESATDEIISDPVLRNQYADTYSINPQDTAALKQSIMNEGSKFVEDNVKRRNLGNPNTKIVINNGSAEEPVLGWTKAVQGFETGGYNSTSAGTLGVNSPGYSTKNVRNLTNQTGNHEGGGALSSKIVNEITVLPYVQAKDKNGKLFIRPAKDGDKNAILGYKPFVMFGTEGSKFFLPADEFTYTKLMSDGKEITAEIRKSVREMTDYAAQLQELYKIERMKEGPIKNAWVNGDTYALTNELKNKIK